MDEIRSLLGEFPKKVELKPQTIEEVDCGSYTRYKVSYMVEVDERITAYLCIPKNISGKVPAIFCHHQHNREFDIGKSEVVGLVGNPDQAYAKELAERGYITFAPDAIAFEERQGVGEYFELATRLVQGKTLIAKVLHDASVGIDYLLTRVEVDAKKIGFIGHSYGGRMALWLPAFDNRVKASVSNCGCIDYRNSLTYDTGIQMEFCIPGIMKKFDIEDIIAGIKDCPLLIHAGAKDEWSRGYVELFESVMQKGNKNVELRVFGTGHVFTPEMRENAYQFLAKNLD